MAVPRLPGGDGGSQQRSVYTLPPAADTEERKQAWLGKRFNRYSGASIFTMEMPDMPWLIDGLIPKTGYGFLAGLPKTGKTWAALSMMLCSMTGRDWCGRKTHPTGRAAVYLAAEGSLPSYVRRCQFLMRGYGFTPEDMVPHFNLLHQPNVFLDDPDDFKDLYVGLKALDPGLVILDCLSRLHMCDENSRNEMESKVLHPLKELATSLNTCLIVLHHSRDPIKMGKAVTKFDPLRGSQSLRGWHEFLVWLEPVDANVTGKGILKAEFRNAMAPTPAIVTANINDDEQSAIMEIEQYPDEQVLIANFNNGIGRRTTAPPPSESPLEDYVSAEYAKAVQHCGTVLTMLQSGHVTPRAVRDRCECGPKMAQQVLDILLDAGLVELKDRHVRKEYHLVRQESHEYELRTHEPTYLGEDSAEDW